MRRQILENDVKDIVLGKLTNGNAAFREPNSLNEFLKS